MLITKENSILIIIDVQENLNPVMVEPRQVIKYSRNLLEIAKIMDIPYIVTEQAPEKLGETIIDIRESVDNEIIKKSSFSCLSEPLFRQRIEESGKDQIIIAGIENHVCVLQTALRLKEMGKRVYVVTDATSSRKQKDFESGCYRMKRNGVNLVTYEMVIFEWLETSENPNFKTIVKNFIDRN